MRWFFALTEDSTAFRQYAEMLMVAVYTARKFTSLEPHFIYDGNDNHFTRWLTRHGVRIIRHRSVFRDALVELGRRKANPHFAAALSGAFSRVELPESAHRASRPTPRDDVALGSASRRASRHGRTAAGRARRTARARDGERGHRVLLVLRALPFAVGPGARSLLPDPRPPDLSSTAHTWRHRKRTPRHCSPGAQIP